MEISYSRFSTYLTCPQQHYFRYVELLRLKKPERPLMFGKDFHSLLQYRYKPKKLAKTIKEIEETFYDLPNKYQIDIGESYVEDLTTIFYDYKKVWKEHERPISLEQNFEIPIGKLRGEPVIFNGIIDEIYENSVMGEHKTFSTRPDIASLAMNTQVCLYSKAQQLLTGEPFQRVKWDYIKSKPAVYPVWLDKSQRFSVASNANITPFSWLRACEEKGVSDEKVLEIANSYACNIPNFFFKCNIEIIPEMIDTVWYSFKEVARDIALHGQTKKVKNITKNCSWCDYRAICYAEFTGANVKQVIKTDFTVKER